MRSTIRGRRAATVAAGGLTLALALSACAPGGNGDEPDATAPPVDADTDPDAAENGAADDDAATGEGATSLRVTVWTGNEDHLALFDSIAEDFVAQHDTVEEVDFDVLAFDDYNDALTVQLAGGNPPDLGWIFERNAPEFVEAGVLHDVGPELRDGPDYGSSMSSKP